MSKDFDFDVEFEEAFIQNKPVKKDEKKPLFPELKIRQKKVEEEEKAAAEEKAEVQEKIIPQDTLIFTLRTTANREDQVMDFVTSNVIKKKINVYSISRPHGMKGYVFIEAETLSDAEQAIHGIPYAKNIIDKPIEYKEIEHMFDQIKVHADIRKNDIVEIIAGPFKREKAKVTRIDHTKEDVVVELLEAAVPIPMTLKTSNIKVIRREGTESEDK